MRPTHSPALLAFALCVGCVPVLTTPGGAVSAADWTAPVNSWDSVDSLPADLVAEGWLEGQVAPDMRLIDQHGDEVSLWQFYGDVVAIDVSTIWCGPCQALAKEVDEVWGDYRARGFMYVTLLPENLSGEVPSVEDLNTWAGTHDISAPILADDEGHAYEIEPNQAWPHVLVVGRDMRVSTNPVVPAEDSSIRDAIEAAL